MTMRTLPIWLNTLNTVLAAWQAYELYTRVGYPHRIIAVALISAGCGACWYGVAQNRRMYQHMTRIGRLSAARRGVPSGSSTKNTETTDVT